MRLKLFRYLFNMAIAWELFWPILLTQGLDFNSQYQIIVIQNSTAIIETTYWPMMKPGQFVLAGFKRARFFSRILKYSSRIRTSYLVLAKTVLLGLLLDHLIIGRAPIENLVSLFLLVIY